MENPSLRPAIEAMQLKLRDQEKAVARTKELINELCVHAGLPAMYAVVDETGSGPIGALNADTFYGKALSTGVREYLEMRRATNQGPATVNEIHAALVQGGYVFETRDEDNAKRGLRESLTKNTSIFHRLPGGQYGLRSWYPTVRDPKPEEKGRKARKRGKTAARKIAKSAREQPAGAADRNAQPVRPLDAAINVLKDAPKGLHVDALVDRLEQSGVKVNRRSLQVTLYRMAKSGDRGVTRGHGPKTFTVVTKAHAERQNGAAHAS